MGASHVEAHDALPRREPLLVAEVDGAAGPEDSEGDRRGLVGLQVARGQGLVAGLCEPLRRSRASADACPPDSWFTASSLPIAAEIEVAHPFLALGSAPKPHVAGDSAQGALSSASLPLRLGLFSFASSHAGTFVAAASG